MEMEFIRNRITELRLKKGVSEYQLSYDLGHSKNYIHNIVTGYSQPSVKELLYLIDTLGITPRLFFDEEAEYRNPILVQEIINGIKSMNDQDLEAVLSRAQVIDVSGTKSDVIRFGATVLVADEDTDDEKRYQIVGD